MSVLTRRLVRLARTGSPAAVARATRRELELRRDDAALEAGLASGGPVVAGPFLGEVGYELLYWRPFVLRLLRMHGVDAERVTVVGRGGSAAWYGAGRAVDAFDLVQPERLRAAAAQRRYGSPKQLEPDDLDRELLARAGADGATVVHPRAMYWRLRHLWEGTADPERALELGDYDDLPRTALSPALEEALPAEYVAVKAYTNECVADPRVLAEIVATVARSAPVVLLAAPVAADTHEDVRATSGVVEISHLLAPATNLAQQAEVVARARALVSTYGGFSYLGPLLGVPTVAFASRAEDNPRHERVLRAIRPEASFSRVAAEGGAVVRGLAT